MRLLRTLVALGVACVLLSSCGIFGCSGGGGNSGFALGCGVGARF